MPLPLPRLRTVAVLAGAALLAKRAMRRRIEHSPLWPLPALDEPVSGRSQRRSTTGRRLLITERTTPADGVVQLRLEGPDLPPWQPGAHLDLVLPSGLVRQYSLCGDPADTGSYTVATRLAEDGRGGSREVHAVLHEGAEAEVRGPRNRFPLADAPAHVLVAGGIGITPILPMVRALAASGADWRLLYGGAAGRRCRSWKRSRSWEPTAAGSPSSRRTRRATPTSRRPSRTRRRARRCTAAAPSP